MRVWDIAPGRLCRSHLLGEHREIHAIWVVITRGKKGYCRHPEVLRWKGKLKALYLRHEKLVEEFAKRGYNHYSVLRKAAATGKPVQDVFVDPVREQLRKLKNKKCACRV
jgi:hypothetical protein